MKTSELKSTSTTNPPPLQIQEEQKGLFNARCVVNVATSLGKLSVLSGLVVAFVSGAALFFTGAVVAAALVAKIALAAGLILAAGGAITLLFLSCCTQNETIKNDTIAPEKDPKKVPKLQISTKKDQLTQDLIDMGTKEVTSPSPSSDDSDSEDEDLKIIDSQAKAVLMTYAKKVEPKVEELDKARVAKIKEFQDIENEAIKKNAGLFDIWSNEKTYFVENLTNQINIAEKVKQELETALKKESDTDKKKILSKALKLTETQKGSFTRLHKKLDNINLTDLRISKKKFIDKLIDMTK